MTRVSDIDGRRWVAEATAAVSRAGHRSSSPRAAVIEALGRQECVRSARDIADALRADGTDVGFATVYRALELLEELGLVQRLDLPGGGARFEPALPGGEHHHHHVICDSCGEVTAFEDARLERAITELAKRLDHRVQAHDVVLHGACPDCVASG